MRTQRGRGRPPLPKGLKKGNLIAFKISDAELKALDRKAKKLGLSRSEVIREGMKRVLNED